MVKTVANMSVSETDVMIRIYSDKIFELQDQRTKITDRELLKKLVKHIQQKTNYKSKMPNEKLNPYR